MLLKLSNQSVSVTKLPKSCVDAQFKLPHVYVPECIRCCSVVNRAETCIIKQENRSNHWSGQHHITPYLHLGRLLAVGWARPWGLCSRTHWPGNERRRRREHYHSRPTLGEKCQSDRRVHLRLWPERWACRSASLLGPWLWPYAAHLQDMIPKKKKKSVWRFEKVKLFNQNKYAQTTLVAVLLLTSRVMYCAPINSYLFAISVCFHVNLTNLTPTKEKHYQRPDPMLKKKIQ